MFMEGKSQQPLPLQYKFQLLIRYRCTFGLNANNCREALRNLAQCHESP